MVHSKSAISLHITDIDVTKSVLLTRRWTSPTLLKEYVFPSRICYKFSDVNIICQSKLLGTYLYELADPSSTWDNIVIHSISSSLYVVSWYKENRFSVLCTNSSYQIAYIKGNDVGLLASRSMLRINAIVNREGGIHARYNTFEITYPHVSLVDLTHSPSDDWNLWMHPLRYQALWDSE